LASATRVDTVDLIAHLGEVERRGLQRGEGCGSLYGYCLHVLKMSEAEAVNRIRAARAARRFPIVLEMLADGRLNLTSVRLLAPHLTPENHRGLLDEARGMTRREVDRVVARLSPRPDVPSSISTLAPGRYGLAVTLGEQAHADLRWLQDAERRHVPDGDPSEIVTRALRAYRRKVEKARFSATERPRASRGLKPGARGASAAVERAVWERDGGRCAFIAGNGRRCTETTYLEFHHREPYGIGGEPTTANIALRCRAHNQYEAEVAYGKEVASRWRDAEAQERASLTVSRCRSDGGVTGPGTSASVVPPRVAPPTCT
jgi:hypothetical protein